MEPISGPSKEIKSLDEERKEFFDEYNIWINSEQRQSDFKLTKLRDSETGPESTEEQLCLPFSKPTSDTIQTDNNIALRLFICDLLKAPVTFKNTFLYKNTEFLKVLIAGVITEKYETKSGFGIIVDDGTGQIRCILSYQSNSDVINADEVNYWISANENDKNLNSCERVLLRKLKNLSKTLFPPYDELNIGDSVVINGKMKEYKDVKYVYADRLEKISEFDDTDYLCRLIKYSLEMYEKLN